jgi:hypothetical protein
MKAPTSQMSQVQVQTQVTVKTQVKTRLKSHKPREQDQDKRQRHWCRHFETLNKAEQCYYQRLEEMGCVSLEGLWEQGLAVVFKIHMSSML